MSVPKYPDVDSARAALDAHVREIVQWHFSPETGTPYWIEWARQAGIDARESVRGVEDLSIFPNFDGELLRKLPHEQWVPKAYEGRPFTIFETGGTTGMPKQRIGWEDYKIDYEEFSESLLEEAFPRGGYWLMVGPTGPRRLRLAIEHLANHRGCSCYFIDLDPRWVKKLLKNKDGAGAKAYMEHVVAQAVSILENRNVQALFTTPKLLEALSERLSIPEAGIKGVFCGGTEMSPQTTRFLCEEVLEGEVDFVPTYGNTLMGLAAHKRPLVDDGLLDHLLRTATTGFASGRRFRGHRPRRRLRPVGEGRVDHADQGVLHAALPGTRRSDPTAALSRVSLGRCR